MKKRFYRGSYLRFGVASGFTLIELMITVAILAILLSIAIPNYSNYLLRAKRSEGRSTLMDVIARQERFYSDNQRYANSLSDIGLNSAISENGYYTITVSSTTPFQAAIATATPKAPFVDAECGALSITTANVRSSGGGTDCWSR